MKVELFIEYLPYSINAVIYVLGLIFSFLLLVSIASVLITYVIKTTSIVFNILFDNEILAIKLNRHKKYIEKLRN